MPLLKSTANAITPGMFRLVGAGSSVDTAYQLCLPLAAAILSMLAPLVASWVTMLAKCRPCVWAQNRVRYG